MNGRALLVLVIRIGLAIAAFVAALFALGTLAWPMVLSAAESATGFFLTPEQGIRWTIMLTVAIGIVFLFLKQRTSGERLYGVVGWTLLAMLILLTPLFAWDPTALKDENAWIRYPTAIALFANGLLLWLLSRRYNAGERWPQAKEWFWIVLAVGFLFAGADELLQVHELIGGAIERMFKLPHVTTDLITVVYGVVGLIIVILGFRFLKQILATIPKTFFALAAAALTLFGLSTMFDTFDVKVWDGINFVVGRFYESGGVPLPRLFDYWYTPGLLLNGMEEVFEFFAGILFLLATVSVLFRDFARHEPPAPIRRRQTFALGIAFLLLLIVPTFFVHDMYASDSPFADGTAGTAVADGADGLYHTDGLAFDRAKGLYIANESRPDYLGRANGPGVFRLADGAVTRLSDPDGVLKDTDSVTVFGGEAYASDGATGAIFRFDEASQRYVKLSDRDRGLKVPEAMTSHDGALYVLDEHFRSIARVEKDGSVQMSFPKHENWQNPEDVLWVDELNGFLVTDDRTGTIFLYRSQDDFTVWADRSDGLKETESLTRMSDTILVTDNGRGEIVGFDLKGNVQRRWTMRWLYRDLQGIAAASESEVYVVTSNAYGSVSFMPGIVWRFSTR